MYPDGGVGVDTDVNTDINSVHDIVGDVGMMWRGGEWVRKKRR